VLLEVLDFKYTDKLVINLFLISDMKRSRRNNQHGIKENAQETEGVSIHRTAEQAFNQTRLYVSPT
jgi:hypothetical protein